MKNMKNDYYLTPGHKTTGMESIGPDINAYNMFGHTPTQVAIMAGNIKELEEMLETPGCEPFKPSRFGHSTAWCLHSHHVRMHHNYMLNRKKRPSIIGFDDPVSRTMLRMLEEFEWKIKSGQKKSDYYPPRPVPGDILNNRPYNMCLEHLRF